MKITIITHTRNSAQHLPHMLATTAWADQRIIIDMASSDNSVALAEQAGCQILHTEVAPRVDAIRNQYLEHASNDWLLVLDSDEYLANDAPQAIAALIDGCDASIEAFSIPRFNYIGDTLLRSSGWYPDHQIRLFRKGCVRWADSNHRPPTVRGGRDALQVLEPPACLHIHHHNYRDLRELLSRQLNYALNDVYASDTAEFDYGDYVTRAYQTFAARHHPEDDGDLSTALATIMAWDAVIRGLIHWDQLDRQPSLEQAFALPVVPTTPTSLEIEAAQLRQRVAELEQTAEEYQRCAAELAVIKNTATWRLSRDLLGRFPRGTAWLARLFRRT